jgi:bilin biosynthesis protein
MSLMMARAARRMRVGLLLAAAMVPATAFAQLDTLTPAKADSMCNWEGWLPPAAARERLRRERPLTADEERRLVAKLASADEHVRDQAARALSVGRQRSTVEALIALLADSNKNVRDGAARSLGRIGDQAAVVPLAQLVADSDVHVQQASVWALGQLQDPRGLDAVLLASRSPSKGVRDDATWALGLVGGPAARRRATELLADESEHVRAAAACSLRRIDGARDEHSH